jgi:glycerol uptake facilitator-like aquaporin
MNYLLIEFLGVFFLVLYRGLSSINVEANNLHAVCNAVVTGFILMIFVIYSEGLSKGMFNSSFAIVENLWKKMTMESALGYISAHLIACFCATSVLSIVVPFEAIKDLADFKNGRAAQLGLIYFDSNNDFFSIFTAEMVGAFLLFFGFLYYSDQKTTDRQGVSAIYYGGMAAALQLANFKISGGVYNLSLVVGGILFEGTLDSKLVAMFCGNIFGTVISKMLYMQILGPKKKVEVNKTLHMMLHKS